MELETGQPQEAGAASSVGLPVSIEVRRLEDLVVELRAAVQSHEEVGQAVGVLMATHRISSQQAFDRLRSASQHANLKLRRLARTLVQVTAGDTTIDRAAHDVVMDYLLRP